MAGGSSSGMLLDGFIGQSALLMGARPEDRHTRNRWTTGRNWQDSEIDAEFREEARSAGASSESKSDLRAQKELSRHQKWVFRSFLTIANRAMHSLSSVCLLDLE